jgi:hypothetical protein
MHEKQQSVLVGGLAIALLSTSYIGLINCFCCAGIILGAMFGVRHYTSLHGITIASGEGATIGALAGLLGGVIAFFLNLLLAAIGLDANEAIMNVMLSIFRDYMPPEQYETFMEQRERSPGAGEYVFNFFLGITVSSIFGAIGGAIGAALFKKGESEEM